MPYTRIEIKDDNGKIRIVTQKQLAKLMGVDTHVLRYQVNSLLLGLSASY